MINIDMILRGVEEGWAAADEIANSGVPVILRPADQHLANFESLRAREDNAAYLHSKGVKLAFTSGGDFEARLRQEAGLAVTYGLDRNEAMKAITQNTAQILKLENVGTLEPGNRANLVLWNGDPFEVTTMAEQLWIDGQQQPLTTRQLELARRYLKQ